MKPVNSPSSNNSSPNNVKSKYSNQALTVKTDLMNTFDSRWAQIKITGKNIPNRSNHAAVICSGYMFVHGGYDVDKGVLSDFYKIDLSQDLQRNGDFTWVQLNNECQGKPVKLKNHTSITYKEKIYMFGGEKNSAQSSNVTYIYDIYKNSWSTVPITNNVDLPQVDSHSVTVINNVMYLYGGYIPSKAELLANIYALDLDKLTWSCLFESKQGKDSKAKNNTEPEGRSNCDMVAYGNDLYVFGGSNGVYTLNDFWKFSLTSKTWEKITTQNTPSVCFALYFVQPRRGHSMIIFDKYLFMFGGIQDITKEKNDVYVYEFSSKNWRKIHTSTNSVYDCSPTLKRQKRKEPKSPEKLNLVRISPEKSSQGGDAMKKILNQNKQKKFQERKKQLLKQFSEKPGSQNTSNPITGQSKPRSFSPTTQSMLKTLQAIGNQQSSRKQAKQQIIYDDNNRKIIGKKPCARDGQTICRMDDCMYIFGGDRHLMAFNDLYSFDLAKGIKSLQLYGKRKGTADEQ